MDKNLVTSISWDSFSYVWEVKDFLELREMAENELSEASSRIESGMFGSDVHGIYFILWLFPYGQKQHSSVGSIDLSLMCKKIQNTQNDFVIAKWSAYFLDEEDNQISRTKLKDPLKKYNGGGDGRRFSYSPTESSIHKWLVHGTLRIKCNVHIALNVVNEVSPYISKSLTSGSMMSDVLEYCKREDSKDITIVCQNFVYPASKFMLCSRSEVLRKMLNGNFKEGRKSEVHLMDISSVAAKNMLDFIHVDTCPIIEAYKNKNNKQEKHAQDLLDLFAVADKYDIKALYAICLEVLTQLFDEKTFVDIMNFAEQVNCKRLTEAGRTYLQQTNGWIIWEKLRNNEMNKNKSLASDAVQSSLSLSSSPFFSSSSSSFSSTTSHLFSSSSLSSACSSSPLSSASVSPSISSFPSSVSPPTGAPDVSSTSCTDSGSIHSVKSKKNIDGDDRENHANSANTNSSNASSSLKIAAYVKNNNLRIYLNSCENETASSFLPTNKKNNDYSSSFQLIANCTSSPSFSSFVPPVSYSSPSPSVPMVSSPSSSLSGLLNNSNTSVRSDISSLSAVTNTSSTSRAFSSPAALIPIAPMLMCQPPPPPEHPNFSVGGASINAADNNQVQHVSACLRGERRNTHFQNVIDSSMQDVAEENEEYEGPTGSDATPAEESNTPQQEEEEEENAHDMEIEE